MSFKRFTLYNKKENYKKWKIKLNKFKEILKIYNEFKQICFLNFLQGIK